VIPEEDLETLQSFNSHDHITLSAYLRLDTAERRAAAHQEFVRQMEMRLAECQPQPECREAIQEDMEIVGLYLKSNGHRQVAGVAIFSCAAEFFWRAYPLSRPLPTQVAVGDRFRLEPLLEAALERSPSPA